MILTDNNPIDDVQALWNVQIELLRLAEEKLGHRDDTWEIRKPRFTSSGPMTRFCKKEKWAYSELSQNAEGYWPTAIFEMGHETVHLLDPVPIERSTHLEESVAVAFSLYVCKQLCNYDAMQVLCNYPNYMRALWLVQQLEGNPLNNGRRIREKFGRLSSVDMKQTSELYPATRQDVLIELSSRFPPR